MEHDVAAGKKMTNEAESQWGVMLENKAGFTTTQVYWTFLLSAGGELFTPDGKASAFNSEAGLETLTFLADHVYKYKISPHKLYTDLEAWNDWGTRKIGSILLYPDFTANILATKVRSATKTAPYKVKKAAHFAGNYWTLSTLSKNKEAAAKFCQWWVQPAISGRWAGESGATPNSQAAADHPNFRQFLAQNPLGQAFWTLSPLHDPSLGSWGCLGSSRFSRKWWSQRWWPVCPPKRPWPRLRRARTRSSSGRRRHRSSPISEPLDRHPLQTCPGVLEGRLPRVLLNSTVESVAMTIL
jgi:multiple sugar transport system substrate-binding protein